MSAGQRCTAASRLIVRDGFHEPLIAQIKRLCERLGAKPKTVFLPIRVAVTGSRISPGLYESLELLGRDVSLARLRHGGAIAG